MTKAPSPRHQWTSKQSSEVRVSRLVTIIAEMVLWSTISTLRRRIEKLESSLATKAHLEQELALPAARVRTLEGGDGHAPVEQEAGRVDEPSAPDRDRVEAAVAGQDVRPAASDLREAALVLEPVPLAVSVAATTAEPVPVPIAAASSVDTLSVCPAGARTEQRVFDRHARVARG